MLFYSREKDDLNTLLTFKKGDRYEKKRRLHWRVCGVRELRRRRDSGSDDRKVDGTRRSEGQRHRADRPTEAGPATVRRPVRGPHESGGRFPRASASGAVCLRRGKSAPKPHRKPLARLLPCAFAAGKTARVPRCVLWRGRSRWGRAGKTANGRNAQPMRANSAAGRGFRQPVAKNRRFGRSRPRWSRPRVPAPAPAADAGRVPATRASRKRPAPVFLRLHARRHARFFADEPFTIRRRA